MRRHMPRLPQQCGSLATVGNMDMPLFDIVRALHSGNDGMTFLWWVRSGQWAHWGLGDEDRWFICRLMTAWSMTESDEVDHAVRELGLSLSVHSAKARQGAIHDLSLSDLLWRKGKGLTKQWAGATGERAPSVLAKALHLLEDVDLICCHTDLSSWPSGAVHPSRGRPRWLETTLVIGSSPQSRQH